MQGTLFTPIISSGRSVGFVNPSDLGCWASLEGVVGSIGDTDSFAGGDDFFPVDNNVLTSQTSSWSYAEGVIGSIDANDSFAGMDDFVLADDDVLTSQMGS
jgi:hypothetical protein